MTICTLGVSVEGKCMQLVRNGKQLKFLGLTLWLIKVTVQNIKNLSAINLKESCPMKSSCSNES